MRVRVRVRVCVRVRGCACGCGCACEVGVQIKLLGVTEVKYLLFKSESASMRCLATYWFSWDAALPFGAGDARQTQFSWRS